MTVISEQIKDLTAAGVSTQEINEWSKGKVEDMIGAGIPAKEITEAFGVVPFDRKNEKNYWKSISSEVEKEVENFQDINFSKMESIEDIPKEVNAAGAIEKFLLGSDERYQFLPYVKKALGASGVNKMLKYHTTGEFGFEVDMPQPEGTGFLEKLTESAVGLVAELPTFIPGAAIGGLTSGPGGAVVGGGFTAGAIQGMYTEALAKGQVKNYAEWWDIFMEEGLSEGAKTAAKLYAAYKLPSALGVTSFIPKTLLQSSGYTAAGAVLGDGLPTAEDFAITTLLFAPFNIKASKQKLENVSKKTGKKPVDIIEDLIQDRTIWEDLNSTNIEIPRAYKDISIKEKTDLSLLEKTKIEEKITELKNKNQEIYKLEREKNNKDGKTTSEFYVNLKKKLIKENPEISQLEIVETVKRELSNRTNKKLQKNILKIQELEKKLDILEPISTKDKPNKIIDETRTELDKSIAYETKQRTFDTKGFVDDLFYNFLDQNHVYKRAVKQAEKFGVKYEKEISPYENFQLLHGVKGPIESFIEKGAIDYKTGEIVGPALKSIFTKYKINNTDLYKDFIRYSISKRAIEKSSQKLETGVNIKAAEKFVKENPKFEAPFREVVKTSELSLKYLYDAGVIPKETYQAALKANKDFVPFYRDFIDGSGRGNFSKNVRNPLKFFKGSKRQIVDPFESVYNNISTYITIAKRNEANLSFIEMIEKVRKVNPDFFPEVQLSVKRTKETKISAKELESVVDNPASLKPSVAEGFSVFRKESGLLKDSEIVVYRNGKREVWEVGEAFARPTKMFDKTTFQHIANFFSIPSRTLRAGATGAGEFIYNNVARDAVSGAILSKGWYVPFSQTLTGIAMTINPLSRKTGYDKISEKYQKSEALQNSLVTFDRTYFNQSMKEYFTNTRPTNIIKNLPEFFRIYTEFSEGINRKGVFKYAVERNLKKGLSEKNAIRKAAVETRDNPIDYRRMGASIQSLNQISAFFNARIQGLNQTVKAFKDRPIQTLTKTFMYVTLPSVLLWMRNHDDPDYQSLPQWRKDLFWNIRVNGTYYPIAKPFEIGLIFGTGAERFLDYYFDKDPKALEKFKDAVGVQTFKGLIPIPDVVKPYFETKNNRSFFFDRPIIPAGLENIPSEYQYTDFTSETTKLIAGLIRKLNGDDFSAFSSPLVLENAWRGWTGGIGGYVLALSDSLLDAAGIVDRSNNRKKMLSEYPIIKAIFIKNPDRNAEPITDFRKLYEPVMKRINAKRILENRGEIEKAKIEQDKLPANWVALERAYRALQLQEDVIRNINEGTKNPEEKLYLINIVLKDMINGAKEAVNQYYNKDVYTIKLDND
jgi:hypothetical protein